MLGRTRATDRPPQSTPAAASRSSGSRGWPGWPADVAAWRGEDRVEPNSTACQDPAARTVGSADFCVRLRKGTLRSPAPKAAGSGALRGTKSTEVNNGQVTKDLAKTGWEPQRPARACEWSGGSGQERQAQTAAKRRTRCRSSAELSRRCRSEPSGASSRADRSPRGCRSKTTKRRRRQRLPTLGSTGRRGTTTNGRPSWSGEKDDEGRSSAARTSHRRGPGPTAQDLGSDSRIEERQSASKLGGLPAAVITQGLIGQSVQLPGLGVLLDLSIPRGGVEFVKPAAEIGELLRRQRLDLLLDRFDTTHDGLHASIELPRGPTSRACLPCLPALERSAATKPARWRNWRVPATLARVPYHRVTIEPAMLGRPLLLERRPLPPATVRAAALVESHRAT